MTKDADPRARIEELERDLRASEARYRGLMDHTTDGLFIQDKDSRILDVNRQASENLGYAREELLGKTPFEFDADVTRDQLDGILDALKDGRTLTVESRHRRKDGSIFPVEIRLRAYPVGGDHVSLAIVRDITERKRIEEGLRNSEQRLRRAQQMAGMASWAFEIGAGEFVDLQESFELLGKPPSPVRTMTELLAFVHPDDVPRMREAWLAALTGAPYDIEHRILAEGEAIKWLHVRAWLERDDEGRPTRLVGVTQDVTAHKKLEEQLAQSQKMEAIGQLAGGVAHDFNNLLTVINGYAEMLLDDAPAGAEGRRELDVIREAGRRAAELTRQLLTFSRKQITRPEELDLNAHLARSEGIIRRLIGEDVSVGTVLAPDLARVSMDKGELEQVLLNLAVNARDAMPTGGRLTFRTANVIAREGAADLRPGPAVELCVTDTGAGIPEAVKPHIFEPFFTTKAVGQGTGLGLATVYGIVKKAGGHIGFESEVGRGTTFRILLPAIAPHGAARPVEPQAKAPAGAETVLVAEDEPALRRLVERVLTARGYTVLAAGSAEGALRLLDAHAGRVHLLLTDVVMPDHGGRELADLARAKQPGLKVLFMSGHTDDAVLRHGVEAEGSAFLQKPFTPADLAGRVRMLLGGPR